MNNRNLQLGIMRVPFGAALFLVVLAFGVVSVPVLTGAGRDDDDDEGKNAQLFATRSERASPMVPALTSTAGCLPAYWRRGVGIWILGIGYR